MADPKSGDKEKGSQPPPDAAARQVQETVDQENEQGFVGVEVDETPNHAYTVQGVVAGEPTPETDPDLRRELAAKAAERRG